MSSPLIDRSQVDPSRANENVRVYRLPLEETVDLSACKKTLTNTTDQFGGDVLKTHWDLTGLPAASPILTLAKQLAQDLKQAVPGYVVTMMSRKAEVWGTPEEVTTLSFNVSFAHARKQCYVYFILA